MTLSPSANLEERTPARVAAQSILRHGFNYSAAAKELRPDLETHGSYAAKLSSSPEVAHQLEVILNRTERNVSKFKDSLWESIELYKAYIARGEEPPKHVSEVAQTAMRILAKPYLDPKMSKAGEQEKGFVVEGLESGAAMLAGESASKKVQ